jgi:hypothetical protein
LLIIKGIVVKQEKDTSIIAPVCYIMTAGLLLYLVVSGYNCLTSSSDDKRDPIDPNVTTEETNINTTGNQPPEDDLKKEPHEADPQNFAKDRDDKRLIMSSIKESCGKPWKAGRKEIKEAIIRKVEYIPQPETGLNELHLDVKTAEHQNFIIHVSPEYKINRCPDLFDFQGGETVTVVGYELSGNQGNICATEITRQHAETLRLRDQTTGTYNNELFNHEICRKELEPTQEACWHSWKTPLMEIEGTIRKVEYKTPPLGNFAGLHLDIETDDQQDILVHVFPEPKTSQCPDMFDFQEKEKVTVIGSEFSTPNKQGNICAAEVIRQNAEVPELRLRDPITGDHNNTVFNNKICIDEDELRRNSFFSWTKSFLNCLGSCNDCVDEVAMWKSSQGIVSSCKDCARHVSMIPPEYLQTNYVAMCQDLVCSNCSGRVMPTLCWKNCMKTCGHITGYSVCQKEIESEKHEEFLRKNFPVTWEFIQRQKVRRAYQFLLSLLL